MTKQVFIVAVSGGVDSVVLLHKLMQQNTSEAIYLVAHYDHGIRANSSNDRIFVEKLANKFKLKFEYEEGKLGDAASEETARDFRYEFLRRIAKKHNAEKIIMAHHRDDLLETMVINLIRGTGPRGLAPMKSHTDLLRPLINRTKAELLNYAKQNKLTWVEDATNTDEKYLRNYVRINVSPKLEPKVEDLLKINKRIDDIYAELDLRIKLYIPKKNILNRCRFSIFPFSVRKEIMKAWLESMGVKNITKKMIIKLVVASATLEPGKQIDISKNLVLSSHPQNITINHR